MTSSPTLGDAFDNYCFAKIMRIRNDYLSTLLAVHLMQFFVVVYYPIIFLLRDRKKLIIP